MIYNRSEVLAHADAEAVANALGIPIKRHGRFKQILCPGHMEYFGKPDTSYGNCVLTEKGYHCFACNRSVNVFDMVMETKGCSFHDALEFVAGVSGVEGEEISGKSGKKSKKVKRFRNPLFNKDELALIGIAAFGRETPIKQEVLKEDAKNPINKHELHRFRLSDESHGMLEMSNEKYFSLYDLETHDFDTFFEMLRGKMKEAMNKRNEAIELIDKAKKGNKLYPYKDDIIQVYLSEIAKIRKMAYKLMEAKQKRIKEKAS